MEVFPSWAGTSDRQLAHLLPLLQVLDFGIDEVTESLQVNTAFRARAHENIAPDSGGGDGVVDRKLERTVEPDHLLHEVVWTGICGAGPGDADGKPPTKRLHATSETTRLTHVKVDVLGHQGVYAQDTSRRL